MTLDEINTLMQSWMKRDDVSAGQFTALVEADCNRRLRVADMVCPCKTRMLSGTAVYSLPDDWAGARTIAIQSRMLKSLTAEQFLAVSKTIEGGGGDGMPWYYSIIDHTLSVWPTPVYELEQGQTIENDAPTIEIIYYKRIQPLSDTNGQNWLSVKHPDVYLYGCSNYANQFIRDMEEAAKFKGMYEEAMIGVEVDDQKTRWSGDAGVIRLAN